MLGEVKHATIQVNGNLVAGTALMPLIYVPNNLGGDSFTLLSAFFQAGALTGVGTAYKMELVHGGYRGTALGGTVATFIGGSAAASNFVADTVYPWTIITTSNLNKFAAGDSLSVRKVADGTNMSPSGVIMLEYLVGR